jgi:hypothetical protein
VGTVRTDTLERMAASGTIAMKDFKGTLKNYYSGNLPSPSTSARGEGNI